jgi:hypothetical protein
MEPPQKNSRGTADYVWLGLAPGFLVILLVCFKPILFRLFADGDAGELLLRAFPIAGLLWIVWCATRGVVVDKLKPLEEKVFMWMLWIALLVAGNCALIWGAWSMLLGDFRG